MHSKKLLFHFLFNHLKPKTMKQIRILAATLLMLAGISVESLAQSPTIQKEVRLVESTTNGTKYIGLKSNAPAASYTLILPDAAPTANKILQIGTVSGTNATATWADLPAAAWSLRGNALTTSEDFLGTTDDKPLSIRTNNLERIAINGATGAVSITSTLGVTGATSLNSTLGVTGATTLTGLLTANGGATVVGATSITGATNINTTGAAATIIGNTTDANSAVTINTGSTGRLTLGGLQAGESTDEILVLNTDNKVGKITMSTLNAGLYRARGQVDVNNSESAAITGITGLVDADVINITLEGDANMAIPSYYVGRSGTTITVYFSAAFTGKFNYAVIKSN